MTRVVNPGPILISPPIPVAAPAPIVVNSAKVSTKKKYVQKPVISLHKKQSGVKPADFFPHIQQSKDLQSSHGRNLAKKSIRINKI